MPGLSIGALIDRPYISELMFDQNLENTTVDKKQPNGTLTTTPVVNAQNGLKPRVK